MPNAKDGVFDNYKAEILEMAGRGTPAIEIAKILQVKHPNELGGKRPADIAGTIRNNLRKIDLGKEVDSKTVVREYVESLNTTNSSSFHALKTELGLHENEFKLPEPWDDSVKNYKLPIGCNNILFISDLQIPFHDISAITCALKYGQEHQVNTIYLNGDIADHYSISSYEKRKEFRNLVEEIRMTREFLSIIRNVFPNATIIYKLGNHEIRWARYIRQNAKEFEGLEELEFASMFHLAKYNITMVEDTTIVAIGGLTAIHAHEVRGVGGVFPARTLFMKTLTSAICGDCHRTSEYTGKSITDRFHTCWTVGCLSVLRPNYAPGAQYNHGFAHIRTTSDGDFSVKNYRILDGKII